MTANITLPREVVGRLVATWERDTKSLLIGHRMKAASDLMDILRPALAAEPTKQEPNDRKPTEESLAAWAAAVEKRLAAPKQEHPGYVIGSHWLETAYSRICAGEAEADVLRDIGLVREEAFLTGVAHLKAENEALRRDAERYRWMKQEVKRIPPSWGLIGWDAAIDAAMGDKT